MQNKIILLCIKHSKNFMYDLNALYVKLFEITYNLWFYVLKEMNEQ